METTSRQLFGKFEAASAILSRLSTLKIETDQVEAFSKDLKALELNFASSTGPLHLAATKSEISRINANAAFSRILASEDFSGECDGIVAKCEAVVRTAGVPLRDDSGKRPRVRPNQRISAVLVAEIQRLFDMYPSETKIRQHFDTTATTVDYMRCPACVGPMAVDAAHSELRCCDRQCGAIRELVGTVFDDSQFYSQEGQKAKSGTFNPNRHFQFWWTHILAREPEEEIGDPADPDNIYGEKILDQLRAIVTRERMVLRLQTVTAIRAMLREIGRTDLNKNVPLIMKKLTGIGPPQISDTYAVRIENLFTKAIEIGERLRRTDRVNRNYYPYYIGRITEAIIPTSDYESRRLLYYIYVQSRETVETDDTDWEMVCLDLGEITYTPSDRNLGQQYAPI